MKEWIKMEDEKKLNNNELSDEQANKAAGGIIKNYTCGGCKHDFYGRPGGSLSGKFYCPDCYNKIVEEMRKPKPMQPGLR